jgi:SAM-dependent methyltransferase
MSEVEPLPYGRIASLYDVTLTLSGFRCGLTRFLDRLSFDLPGRPCILDAGCGTGLLAYYLLRRLPRAEVVAFDVDRRMLAVMRRSARRRPELAARLTIAEGDLGAPERLRRLDDGRTLAAPPAGYDAITVGAALEHVPLLETLERLHGLLRPGGLLLVLGIRAGPPGAILGQLYRFRPYRFPQLRDAMEKAGFGDIWVEALGARDFPANLTRFAVLAWRRPPPG